MLKLCKINPCSNGTLGIHLSRAPYDPYPWVSGVLENSSAYLSGIRIGDTVLECNNTDVLGWKISELAVKIRSHWDCGGKTVSFLIWRNKTEGNVASPAINQQSLQKFANCLQNIAQLLECPICLEVIKPPGWQCCNGHVLCNSCRNRSVKCPICRVPFGPRGRCLLSDKLFTLLAETFPCDGSKNGSNKNGRCPQELNQKQKNNDKNRKKSQSSAASESSLLVQQTAVQIRTISGSQSNAGVPITTPLQQSSLQSFSQPQTTRIIAVNDQIRTSPVKKRDNQTLSNGFIISNVLPSTTTTTAADTEVRTQSALQDAEATSCLTRRTIAVPTSVSGIIITNASTTTVAVNPLNHPPTIIETPSLTKIHNQMTDHISPSIRPTTTDKTLETTQIATTTSEPKKFNPTGPVVGKLEKQIISLKVKSKSSENLQSHRSYHVVVASTSEKNKMDGDGGAAARQGASISLPSSPISNLVNSKKKYEQSRAAQTATTMNITSGCNMFLLPNNEPSNCGITTATITTPTFGAENIAKTQTTCSSNALWPKNLMSDHKSYNCPTGKSLCVIGEIDEILQSSKYEQHRQQQQHKLKSIDSNRKYSTKRNEQNKFGICYETSFDSLDNKTCTSLPIIRNENTTTYCNNIATDAPTFRSNPISDDVTIEQKSDSSSNMHPYNQHHHQRNYNDEAALCNNSSINLDDIKSNVHSRTLNHLRRKHKISLCQYHCGLHDKIPIDFQMMRNKSNILMCITVDDNDGVDDDLLDVGQKNQVHITDSAAAAAVGVVAASSYHSSDNNVKKSALSALQMPTTQHSSFVPSSSSSSALSSSLLLKSPLSSMSSQITLPSINVIKIEDNEANNSKRIGSRATQNSCLSCCNTTDCCKLCRDVVTNDQSTAIKPMTEVIRGKSLQINDDGVNRVRLATFAAGKDQHAKLTAKNSFNRSTAESPSTSIAINCNQQSQRFESTMSSLPSNNSYQQVYQTKSLQACTTTATNNIFKSISRTDFDLMSRSKSSSNAVAVASDRIQPQHQIKLKSSTTINTPTDEHLNAKAALRRLPLPLSNTKYNSNAFAYTIQIESIQRIRIKSELFFVIKIPLKHYRRNTERCNANEPNSSPKNSKKKCCIAKDFGASMTKDKRITNACQSGCLNQKMPPDSNTTTCLSKCVRKQQQHDQPRHTTQRQETNVGDYELKQSNGCTNSDSFTHDTSQAHNSPDLSIASSSTDDATLMNNNFQQCQIVNQCHQHQLCQLESYCQRQQLQCNQPDIVGRIQCSVAGAVNSASSLTAESQSDVGQVKSPGNNRNPASCIELTNKPSRPRIFEKTFSTNTNRPKIEPDAEHKDENDDADDGSICYNNDNRCCCGNRRNFKPIKAATIASTDGDLDLEKKSAIFVWYCGSDDELKAKNFRAVIEYRKIYAAVDVGEQKRDNNAKNINIVHNIDYNHSGHDNYCPPGDNAHQNNDADDNDDDDDDANDAFVNAKKFEIFNSNNGIRVTNMNSNDANKCIHLEIDVNNSNTKNGTASTSSPSSPSSPSTSAISSECNCVSNNVNDYKGKISLWIHPMTMSWNSIRNQMKFHILDEA